jgi:hypothetical protein
MRAVMAEQERQRRQQELEQAAQLRVMVQRRRSAMYGLWTTLNIGFEDREL